MDRFYPLSEGDVASVLLALNDLRYELPNRVILINPYLMKKELSNETCKGNEIETPSSRQLYFSFFTDSIDRFDPPICIAENKKLDISVSKTSEGYILGPDFEGICSLTSVKEINASLFKPRVSDMSDEQKPHVQIIQNGISESGSEGGDDVQENHIGDLQEGLPQITQLIVVLPNGEEKVIVFNEPLQRLNVPRILEQICHQIGYDCQMEAVIRDIHEEVPEGNIAKDTVDSSNQTFLEIDAKEKEEEVIGVYSVLPPSFNGEKKDVVECGTLVSPGTFVIICKYCKFHSLDLKTCEKCKRSLLTESKTSLDDKNMLNSNLSFKNKVIHKRRRCQKKHRKQEVPAEQIVISSDDDEESEGIQLTPPVSNGKSSLEDETFRNVRDKEPIITEDTLSPFESRIEGGGMDVTELLDSPELEKALLQCRTVRIGSYKVIPEDKVTLSEFGLKIKVPTLNGAPTILKILRDDIVKVLAHFGESMPVLFYYTTNRAGIKVRNALQMLEKHETVYFDPTSKVETQRRITLLPDKISEDTRLFIKSVYDGQCLLDEISVKEADAILVSAAPKEVQTHLRKENYSNSNTSSTAKPPLKIIMSYPPPPAKGALTINTEDYACLGEDQFLNDIIIDFYLKWFVQNKLTPEQQRRTHVFSSFFYNRLTCKKLGSSGKLDYNPKLSPAENRHARVKGWTKSVDLFSKDFIIIPINERSHWFLGVICFPGLTQAVRMSDNTPIQNPPRRAQQTRGPSGNRHVPSVIGATTITMIFPEPAITLIEGDDEERDEAMGDDEDLEPNTSEDEGKESLDGDLMDEALPRVTRSNTSHSEADEAIKQPCILIFDSLAGAGRSRVIATLREYLQVEYSVKHKGRKRDFSKDTVRGCVPKVPQQTNFTDCGLYVLQYVDSLFEKPITNYKMPIKMIRDWFSTDVVSKKRYEIQQLLHKLMAEQNIDISSLNLPNLGLRPEGTHTGYSDDGEEEVEEEGDLAMDEGELEGSEMLMEEGEMEEEEEPFEDEEELEEEEAMTSREMLKRANAMKQKASSVLLNYRLPDVEIQMPERNMPNIEIKKQILPNLSDITVSESSTKRKFPTSLKEVRNPRLISRQSTSDYKRMKSTDQ